MADFLAAYGASGAYLIGALLLVVVLRRAMRTTEVALRGKLFVVALAGVFAVLGLGPYVGLGDLRTRALEAADAHPEAALGFAVSAGLMLLAIVAFVVIRFWIRTLIRIALAAIFAGAVALWCAARFYWLDRLDGLFGTTLGAAAWSAVLEGTLVGALVVLALWILRPR